nr:hypothetical protein Iba_chr05eCG10250 [Ipomoea batatas]
MPNTWYQQVQRAQVVGEVNLPRPSARHVEEDERTQAPRLARRSDSRISVTSSSRPHCQDAMRGYTWVTTPKLFLPEAKCNAKVAIPSLAATNIRSPSSASMNTRTLNSATMSMKSPSSASMNTKTLSSATMSMKSPRSASMNTRTQSSATKSTRSISLATTITWNSSSATMGTRNRSSDKLRLKHADLKLGYPYRHYEVKPQLGLNEESGRDLKLESFSEAKAKSSHLFEDWTSSSRGHPKRVWTSSLRAHLTELKLTSSSQEQDNTKRTKSEELEGTPNRAQPTRSWPSSVLGHEVGHAAKLSAQPRGRPPQPILASSAEVGQVVDHLGRGQPPQSRSASLAEWEKEMKTELKKDTSHGKHEGKVGNLKTKKKRTKEHGQNNEGKKD